MENPSNIDALIQAIKVEGKLIAFEFTLRLDDGYIVDSNVGKEPMAFQSGSGEMLPTLEEHLINMQIDERKHIILTPEQAYGPISKAAYKTFPLAAIPEQARRLGHKVMSKTPYGDEVMVEVVEIQDDKVVLDFNHPLAGQTLHFDVRIISAAPLN